MVGRVINIPKAAKLGQRNSILFLWLFLPHLRKNLSCSWVIISSAKRPHMELVWGDFFSHDNMKLSGPWKTTEAICPGFLSNEVRLKNPNAEQRWSRSLAFGIWEVSEASIYKLAKAQGCFEGSRQYILSCLLVTNFSAKWYHLEFISGYSYLPNKLGDPNKQERWKNCPNGEGGKIFYIHKKSCRGWKISLNLINGHVEGGNFFWNK